MIIRLIFIYVILLFSSSVALNAQSMQSRITFICETKLGNGGIFDGENSLYFNEYESIYIHENVPEETEYIQMENSTAIKRGDPEGFPVYTNLNDSLLYYKSCYGSPRILFIFKEDMPDIQWEITSDVKQIAQFHCIGATGEFGNRTYDVWFTPQIPIGLGPYKLSGLPGMILEARSRDGKVKYHFQSYESPVDDPVHIQKPKIGKYVSWEEFRDYIINKLLRVESRSNARSTLTNNDPPSDYTIEKDKFTIITKYKKQRDSRRK